MKDPKRMTVMIIHP
ncbi:BH1032 [Halalkalibacterium halodurans C-125]|uniref:BH1032 protein n=1 Tax=Halalkalibacterium halodurans (strain ATCC BAA-125 / DSM 18197 / FERM 7344 / JCM 9153 / C-125) TaxID=272558 RepID=Q9KE26_HALH5|nr:BH1032 [Halalkalibacterium halodurans C-125]